MADLFAMLGALAESLTEYHRPPILRAIRGGAYDADPVNGSESSDSIVDGRVRVG
jgi:hypothetical protein